MASPITNDDTMQSIKEKQANIDSYKDSFKPAAPRPPTRTAAVDKVKPGGRYGDKPGEKRIDVSDMTKPLLPSYKHGTDYVPETGPAILHKGEKVVTEKENKMKHDMYGKVHEGDHKPKKAIKEIHTSRAHDGKLIHKHIHHHPEHHPDETHVSNDMAEMHDHMENHAGTPNDGEAPAGNEQMAQLSATPPPAAPPAGGAPAPAGM